MLNISVKRINDNVAIEKYDAFKTLADKKVSKGLIIIMLTTFTMVVGGLFLPWTQNIRSKGYVTTLNPDSRPQNIQSLIGGKIDQWYIQEGQKVRAGDTIIKISEVKEEYLDPYILDRTQSQINAKQASSEAYDTKADNMLDQLSALIKNKEIKLQQNEIKKQQTFLKIQSDSIDLVAADIKLSIAKNQLERMEQLYNEGLKSLTDLEEKRNSVQEANAKVISLENKLATNQNDLLDIRVNIDNIKNEFDDKIAKSKAERNTALSAKYDAEANVNKLQSSFNSYEVRQKNYYITSPINGMVTKAIRSGIGEMIKAGEDLVSIMPDVYALSVEMYVEPRDVPLLNVGQKVRVQFDGWPAIVFSGWPDNSYGTFGGQIFAIDNFISPNGKYRIMAQPDPDAAPWPGEVRVGGGANSLILLNRVTLGYELWRQLNGFPPDYYQDDDTKDIKTKAPLRKVK